jgi:hypothetical protein
MAASPASIPAACGGWGDTAAAYRMLDNERCDWREVIEAHGRCAVRRMAGLPVVLCLNDTTELDFNGQTIQGLGPLSYEAQRGMYLHPTYAVSTQREPLGVLDAWMWAREPRDTRGQRGGLCESTRWIESYERLAERAGELPETRLVQVGDPSILALMQRPRPGLAGGLAGALAAQPPPAQRRTSVGRGAGQRAAGGDRVHPGRTSRTQRPQGAPGTADQAGDGGP